MTLDPRLLGSFVVLAEELHFGRAAHRLHLAQPGLSQQIQRLEQQVGSPLFTRKSRVVALTGSGRAMLGPARAALRAVAQAERAARDSEASTFDLLRVGLDNQLDDFMPALSAYEHENAELMIALSRMPESEGHKALAAAQLDAFIGFLPPDGGGLASRTRTIDIPLLALVKPDDPLAQRADVTLSTFRQSQIVLLARDQSPARFDYFVDVLSEGLGRESLTILELRPNGTAPTAALVEEIQAGQAVGFSSPGGSAASTGLCLVPFDPPLTVPAYVSWHAERSAATDAFVEHLTST